VADAFRRGLIQADISTCLTAQGPIVPVMLGDPERTVSIGERLKQKGFLVAAIRPPSVPAGTSRLRVTFTAAHTQVDQQELLDALREVLSHDRARCRAR
jgi:8-amino-7-oxononanoate synthase